MRRLFLSLLLLVSICACSVERAPLVASDVTITRPIPGTETTAAYFTLSNNTTQEITITHVTSTEFESVQIHESAIEDGMSRMYKLGDLRILAGTSVQFQPGGKHLMLMRPIGDFDAVTLDFHAGKAVMLSVAVSMTD